MASALTASPRMHNETFLTEAALRGASVAEPEAMARVREEHSHLQAVLGTLNQKISGVLSKQEGDFIAAYRAHMYTVQKELQTLRQRVVEAETALQRNDKVQKLEDNCEWYRKEALRLDGFNTAMQKDLRYMQKKLGILGMLDAAADVFRQISLHDVLVLHSIC
eukprot:6812-Heterococcus_DN1.PRE.2